MALTTRLQIKQSQTLKMTPQLLQSIKLLQYNQQELSSYLADQIEQNPFLETESESNFAEDAENLNIALGQTGEIPDNHANDDRPQLTGEEAFDGRQSSDIASQLDIDPEALFPEQTHRDDLLGRTDFSRQNFSSDEDFNALEYYREEVKTLSNHLNDQLGLMVLSPVQTHICSYLIDQLSPAGYLKINEVEVMEQLNALPKDFDVALQALQSMEPTGVGARNIKECLGLQLKEHNRLDPWAECVLDNLHLITEMDLKSFAKKLDIELSDLHDILADIRTLNPKPGLAFDHSPVEVVRPDVRIFENQDGSWRVELCSENLPKILVNESYYALMKPSLRSAEDKVFLNEKLQSASWLVRNLDQRARTILKVAREIVRHQNMFLKMGISYLKPLNLAMVAEAVDMHESSISRVTANKYIETPRGIFEMKYFFSNAVGAAQDGEQRSSEAVKYAIKQLIEGEEIDNIFSDDAIVAHLQAKGIEIARRTVAKYREAMDIPSSSKRRKQKKLLCAS